MPRYFVDCEIAFWNCEIIFFSIETKLRDTFYPVPFIPIQIIAAEEYSDSSILLLS